MRPWTQGSAMVVDLMSVTPSSVFSSRSWLRAADTFDIEAGVEDPATRRDVLRSVRLLAEASFFWEFEGGLDLVRFELAWLCAPKLDVKLVPASSDVPGLALHPLRKGIGEEPAPRRHGM